MSHYIRTDHMTVFLHSNYIFRSSSDMWGGAELGRKQRAWHADSGLENLVTTAELHTSHAKLILSGNPKTFISCLAFSLH